MAWDKGFDFRATSTYVTDPANSTYVLDTDTYPTTRNGVTFGWTVAPTAARDRDAGQDPRIAGINFGNGNGTFRVDLPSAGDYALSVAFGDTTDQTAMNLTIKDNTTLVLTLGPDSFVGVGYFDATDVKYSAAAWPGSNTSVTKTFASTILNLILGVATTNTTIAHLFLSQVSGAASNANMFKLFK